MPQTAGELNYFVTTSILNGTLKDVSDFQFLFAAWTEERGLSYQTINDIAGVVLNVPAEFMRRGHWPAYEQRLKNLGHAYGNFYAAVVIPYGDQMLRENGEVF